mgnify:CR=1 FL=1|tara:strand:+ start:1083 stop:1568 length:486 start_codon:yes stop_codon:yes gene_type:complete
MPVNIPLKKSKNSDAQRQGFVGYDAQKIYGSEAERNAERVKDIFDSSYTSLDSQEIADKMRSRLRSDDYNPDFPSNSIAYDYQVESNSVRSEDLFNVDSGEKRLAPNVSFPSSEGVSSYENPFVSTTSQGGFGNDKFENSLHAENVEGELDSLEILTKYSE